MWSPRQTVWIALALACGVCRASLVINEVCYNNSAVADETGNKSSDWIELYNSGPTGVNILNYGIAASNPYVESDGVRLPNYTIPAGGYLVVFASSDLVGDYTWVTNAPDRAVVPPNATWKYSAPASEPVALWKTNTFNDATWASGMAPFGYNDTKLNLDCATVLGYGGNPANRYPTAYFRQTFTLSDPSTVTGLVVRARLNDGAVVYLNGVEVMRQNMPVGTITYSTLASMGFPTIYWTNTLIPTNGLLQGTNVVAVEVHQASVSSVDLIMDITVTALVQAQVPYVHGAFGLSKDGENVHLFDSTLTRIHKFDSPGFEIGENKSYGLATDGVTGSYTIYARPTPEQPNSTYPQKYQETLTSDRPVLSVQPGVYATGQSVVLSASRGDYRVYFTLDGSDPRDSSLFIYSGYSIALSAASPVTDGLSWRHTNPVEIGTTVPSAAWLPPVGTVGKAVVLRAITVDTTLKYCSPETRGTYFIGSAFTNRTLPVVSLITDTNNLFGFDTGIYVPGKHYGDSPDGYGDNRWGKPYANYHQDSSATVSWERPVYFELIETSQTTRAVAQLLGATMHGGGTRAIPQKTLYLLARAAEYGADSVGYALFPDEAPVAYKRFLLRNSGNDWYGPDYGGVATMMKDAVFHRVVKNLDISVMAYRPTVAYVNGEYWGIHNLRESFDKHYLATRYGLDADNCDLLMHEEDPDNADKVKITRIDGDSNCDEEYEQLVDWIQDNPLNQEVNYQRVQSAVVFTNALSVPITGIDVTNHADYIIAETFFGNTDWPINNCDFWRAHTNQVATSGKYGDKRWRWMLYDLDVAGEEGSSFNMFTYLSSGKMTGGNEPGFLINQLWQNTGFRTYFVSRYANLLNTTFQPKRVAGIVSQAAAAIAPEIQTHYRRWGRYTTQAQWSLAVSNVLVQYTATRQSVSWQHLNDFFTLGGTGLLTVQNENPAGTGGRFNVNGIFIDTSTDGVTNRAAWTGTFFRSLGVPVRALPDSGYAFDHWQGTPVTNASPTVFVGAAPLTLVAVFRPVGDPAYVPSGYESWQLANYTEQEIMAGSASQPESDSGFAGMSNFQLYAFGMSRSDGLTDEQRQARASLSIQNRSNRLWVGYNRLNNGYTDVNYSLKVAGSLAAPIAWSNAVIGVDVDPVSQTNVLDASTWFYEVRLPEASPARDLRFFKIEASQQ